MQLKTIHIPLFRHKVIYSALQVIMTEKAKILTANRIVGIKHVLLK